MNALLLSVQTTLFNFHSHNHISDFYLPKAINSSDRKEKRENFREKKGVDRERKHVGKMGQ